MYGEATMDIVASETGVTMLSPVSPAKRVGLFVAGLLPLIAPYELLLRPDWQGNYLSLAFVVPTLISLGALALSILLMLAAITSTSVRIHFDASTRHLTETRSGLVGGPRVRQVPFAGITRVHVRETTWSDGPPSYTLIIELADDRRLTLGSDRQRESLDQTAEKITAMLASPPQAA
jgi:hypothetical protein